MEAEKLLPPFLLHIAVKQRLLFVQEGITYVIAAGCGGQSRSVEEVRFDCRYIAATRTKEGYMFIVKDMDGHTADEFAISR